MTVIFDTHKYIKTLTDAGVDEKTAEAQSTALKEALETDLATKADLKILKEQMNNRFDHVDNKFKQLEQSLFIKLLLANMLVGGFFLALVKFIS